MTRLAVTVYCNAQSHTNGIWEHTYSREEEDAVWWPDPFEYVGDHIQTCRRDGGIEFVDAAGRRVPTWDSGRSLDEAAARLIPALDRARAAAGLSAEKLLPLGVRYLLRCPECKTPIRRNGLKFALRLNNAIAEGYSRLSLAQV